MSELESKLKDLHLHYEQNPITTNYFEIQLVEESLGLEREENISGIMTKAKARWQAEGARCSNYFCNLEKNVINMKQ